MDTCTHTCKCTPQLPTRHGRHAANYMQVCWILCHSKGDPHLRAPDLVEDAQPLVGRDGLVHGGRGDPVTHETAAKMGSLGAGEEWEVVKWEGQGTVPVVLP